jgi:hypothetical protein
MADEHAESRTASTGDSLTLPSNGSRARPRDCMSSQPRKRNELRPRGDAKLLIFRSDISKRSGGLSAHSNQNRYAASQRL